LCARRGSIIAATLLSLSPLLPNVIVFLHSHFVIVGALE
jgi:hypothetical protein